MLSGGQRQRVALARALFRTEAEVVLFDDVLSAVDHATEQAIVETLAKPAGDAFRPTTFIVSHRLSAIRDADKILVLENGRLIDQGTHAELISRAGPYQEAWDAQSSDGEGGE